VAPQVLAVRDVPEHLLDDEGDVVHVWIDVLTSDAADSARALSGQSRTSVTQRTNAAGSLAPIDSRTADATRRTIVMLVSPSGAGMENRWQPTTSGDVPMRMPFLPSLSALPEP
jgi:hypothetical protein